MAGRSSREFLRSRQIQADAFEGMGQLSHDKSSHFLLQLWASPYCDETMACPWLRRIDFNKCGRPPHGMALGWEVNTSTGWPVTRNHSETDDNRQDEVFAFLADPATHEGAPVRRLDTHSAAVFLAGDRALKVKRAVRYPFLDFSTLAQRKAACEAELAVNRAFAPELYVGVIPITQDADGRLALGGHGESIESAVEMRRVDETKTVDHLADDNAIDLALADRLARAVAATHG